MVGAGLLLTSRYSFLFLLLYEKVAAPTHIAMSCINRQALCNKQDNIRVEQAIGHHFGG
jgi:hypothetical protein